MNDSENYVPEGHIDPDVLTLGTIIFTDIVNEKEIRGINGRYNPKSIGECKIEVYDGEGDIPHFHLSNNDKSFESCICIYSANYFSHGGKYTDKLNSKQCKELDKWLKESAKVSIGNLTNWQTIIVLWDTMNPDCKFPSYRKVATQPNYNNMTDFRSRI